MKESGNNRIIKVWFLKETGFEKGRFWEFLRHLPHQSVAMMQGNLNLESRATIMYQLSHFFIYSIKLKVSFCGKTILYLFVACGSYLCT
jgi:hypothetical protein